MQRSIHLKNIAGQARIPHATADHIKVHIKQALAVGMQKYMHQTSVFVRRHSRLMATILCKKLRCINGSVADADMPRQIVRARTSGCLPDCRSLIFTLNNVVELANVIVAL